MLDNVTYPPQHDPRISPIYALNEVDVKAPAAVVWRLLIDAENWSRWFPPENNVTILGGERDLALGTRYTRVTIGFPMQLVVTECEPGRRLSWATMVDDDDTGSTAFQRLHQCQDFRRTCCSTPCFARHESSTRCDASDPTSAARRCRWRVCQMMVRYRSPRPRRDGVLTVRTSCTSARNRMLGD